jgi:hypothetical protein
MSQEVCLVSMKGCTDVFVGLISSIDVLHEMVAHTISRPIRLPCKYYGAHTQDYGKQEHPTILFGISYTPCKQGSDGVGPGVHCGSGYHTQRLLMYSYPSFVKVL